jgi:hypothetical protein
VYGVKVKEKKNEMVERRAQLKRDKVYATNATARADWGRRIVEWGVPVDTLAGFNKKYAAAKTKIEKEELIRDNYKECDGVWLEPPTVRNSVLRKVES